jgi:hypothetical protein
MFKVFPLRGTNRVLVRKLKELLVKKQPLFFIDFQYVMDQGLSGDPCEVPCSDITCPWDSSAF